MQPRMKIRLGDLLVENKIISEEQLEAALAEQRKSGRKLGRVLIESGYIEELNLLEFLSKQLNIPYVELTHYQFEPSVVELLPEIHARRFRALALKLTPHGLLVGMADPTNIFAYDEITRIVSKGGGLHVHLAVVRESELLQTIDRVYRQTDQIAGLAEQLNDELAEGDIDMGDMVAQADINNAPVVKLLQSIFDDAIQTRASDVHIEPDEASLRIRQRIDGALQEQVLNEKRIASALVLRLKLMAGLDISEKRLPQDGRFTVKVKDRHIDVRMSTMPVHHGESAVLRILDHSAGVRPLAQLGMPDTLRTQMERIIQRPHGMVLVTGPTGSGKTTTLYSALQLLNRPEVKIITVEDPIEYQLPRINQVQVNAEIGLTFARVLRTVLRQDPDIVLVGEMRDQETAEIGLRAALTGHLVLSTLHTNDAISTISRLIDMGAPGYLLAAALQAIVAQRLIRKICTGCAQPAVLDAQAQAWLEAQQIPVEQCGGLRFGLGCHRCNNTGFHGRIGVYELLEINSALAHELARCDHAGFAAVAYRTRGFEPLQRVALRHALAGVTTINEVLRLSADAAHFGPAGQPSLSVVA